MPCCHHYVALHMLIDGLLGSLATILSSLCCFTHADWWTVGMSGYHVVIIMLRYTC